MGLSRIRQRDGVAPTSALQRGGVAAEAGPRLDGLEADGLNAEVRPPGSIVALSRRDLNRQGAIRGNAAGDVQAKVITLTEVESSSVVAVLSWVRTLGQWDKWKGCCLTAIKMAEMRSNDDTTSTREPPHSSL